MIYPLLVKELREKRLAMASGLLWILAPLYFWADYANFDLPFIIDVLLEAAGMVAPAATVLLLASAPFFIERRNGTWNYLQSLPISRRRIVFIKWALPMGLGVFFMSISSGISWYPITHLDDQMNGVSFLPWICLHAAAVSLLISVLLLVDTIDWGEWLGVRAMVTFGLLISFLIFMEIISGSFSWFTITLCAVLSLTLLTIAVVAAPTLTGDSPLPWWRSRDQVTSRHFSPDGAWLWLLWRQMRFVVILLLLPIPLLLGIRALATASYAGSPADLLRMVLGSEKIGPIVALMCICAAIAGTLLPFVDRQSNAQSFRCCLPLRRAHAERMALAFAIGTILLVFAPACLLLVYTSSIAASTTQLLLPGIISVLCLMICICAVMLTASTFANAQSSGTVRFVVLALGIAGFIYVVNHFTGNNTPALALIVPVTLAIVAAAWICLPVIDRQREV